MAGIGEALGLDRAHTQEGFAANERSGAMPVCQRCGALVAYESQGLHLSWHAEAR